MAVFTNEYENNFSYLLDFRAQNILHASSIRPLKKLKLISDETSMIVFKHKQKMNKMGECYPYNEIKKME